MNASSTNTQETHLIYTFPKGNEEKVQIAIKKYKGRYYMDFRVWFQGKETQQFYPTKKGLSLSLDYLQEFKKGISELLKSAPKYNSNSELNV